MPISVSDKLKDFIKKLLIKDPKKRLGANGPQEVLNHPVFSNNENKYNFDMITQRRVKADICTENNNVRYIDYD